ncbi:MAG: DUF5106 domain-containing protein [Bacteroidia bacterium]|nr:DUF5106 domain-containing protein [Bacteroidia bacterium]
MKRIAILTFAAMATMAFSGCDSSKDTSTTKQAPVVMGEGKPLPPQDSSYELSFDIGGFSGDTALLAVRFGSSNRLRDTALVQNGKFVFKGDTALKGGMYMVVLPPENNFFELIIDRDQHFSVKSNMQDLIGNVKVEGSEENELMYRDIALLASMRPKVDSLRKLMEGVPESSSRNKELREQLANIDSTVVRHRRNISQEYGNWLYGKFLATMLEPTIPDSITEQEAQFFWYKKHYFDNVDLTDDRLLRTVALDQKVMTYLDNLTFKDPDSINASINLILNKAEENDEVFKYFVPTILNKYVESKMMGYDGVYVNVVENYYLTGKAWWADSATLAKMEERALALSPNLIGRPAPDFTTTNLSGKKVNLYSMPGEWTILYFWDYDCSHCKTVTPELARVYDKFKDKDVSLFTVSINGTVDIWKERIKDYHFTAGVHTADPSRASGFDAMYDLRSTPRVFVLDKNKIIRYKQITMEQLEDILNHELGLSEE